MDPDETLKTVRALAETVLAAVDDYTETGDFYVGNLAELAERFLALDGWLSSGGFKPGSWAGLRGHVEQRELEELADELGIDLPSR